VDLDKNEVVQKHKTGHQIGEKIEGVEIVGGASPNSVAVGKRFGTSAPHVKDHHKEVVSNGCIKRILKANGYGYRKPSKSLLPSTFYLKFT
jgi:hypothetical protein